MKVNQKNSTVETVQVRPGRGGARPGAGRPKGSKAMVTVAGIIDALESKTNGKTYEDILVEDFVQARLSGDTNLTHKYHLLLSNKFIANLNEITVEDRGDAVDGKRSAFIEAIQALKLINPDKEINNQKDEDDASN